MPIQKDFKKIVRSRMEKTGESYTAARLQLLKKKEPDYAELAGVSEAALKKQTGRSWAEWVKILDAAHCAEKPHREIAEYVYSQGGISGWWSQSVTVGYERIRGLREKGQRRDGAWEANKSRTFSVPVEKLYRAFANARVRARWLPVRIKVRTSNTNKTMRIAWDDDTRVELYFMAKGDQKSAVNVQHQNLRDKAAAVQMKRWWSDRLEALSEMF